MALTSGRIPLSTKEHSALEELVTENIEDQASVTRTDPGDSGPLRVEIGDKAWLIDAHGAAEEVK